MEYHHPIMSKLRDLGDQTYRQTDNMLVPVLVRLSSCVLDVTALMMSLRAPAHLKYSPRFKYSCLLVG